MIDIAQIKRNILSCAYKGQLSPIDNSNNRNKKLNELHSALKKYAPVTDQEKLIDAPKSWIWTRLGYVCHNHGQKVPNEDFSYIDVGTLDNGNQKLSKQENIIKKDKVPSRARKIVEIGDVLYSTVRPYLHNICIVDREFSKTPIASTAFCVMSVNKEVINNKFLFYWLLTPEFDKFANGNHTKGTLYPAIGEKALLNGAIPLPSLQEQGLIVNKLEQIFQWLNTIDELQTRYAADREVLKSKLIDAAIRGKLTKQLPEDGTAEELYQQIQEEKKKLIKEKKIKREKALLPVKAEEKSLEFPQNWVWCKVADIAYVTKLAGFEYSSFIQPNLSEKGIPLFKGKNVQNGKLIYNFESYIPEELSNELSRSQLNRKCLLTPYVGTIGNIAIFPGKFKAHLGSNVGKIELFNRTATHILEEFVLYYLRSSFGLAQLCKHKKATAQDSISIQAIRDVNIVLPPLAEQKRIVEKLESLLPLCDQLGDR